LDAAIKGSLALAWAVRAIKRFISFAYCAHGIPTLKHELHMENAVIDISHIGFATLEAEDRLPGAEAGSGGPNSPCDTCPFRNRRTVGRPPKDTTEVVVVAAPQPSSAMVDGLQTLDVAGLSLIIGRTVKSIKVDCFRRPESLPPRFIIPGSRKMLWRVCDVKDWMDALAAHQAEQRRQAIELASRTGLKAPDLARALRRKRGSNAGP
jgi:hypothetical protein